MNSFVVVIFLIGAAFVSIKGGAGYGILGAKYPILGIFLIWPIAFSLLIASFYYFIPNT
jgi:hypothetical protein